MELEKIVVLPLEIGERLAREVGRGAGATTSRIAAGCCRKTITPTIPSAVFATVSEVPRPITWSKSFILSSDSPIATLISIPPTTSARRVAPKSATQIEGHPAGSTEEDGDEDDREEGRARTLRDVEGQAERLRR